MFVENLTILMPIHNGGKELERALDALRRLDHATNVLFYNDGSEDNTLSLLNKFADLSNHKIKILNSKKNRGYMRAMAILFRLCKTNYFIVHGHDDELSENFLEQFDGTDNPNDERICYFSRTAYVGHGGAEVGCWPQFPINKKHFSSSELILNFRKFEVGNLFVGIWSKRAMNYSHLTVIYQKILDIKPFNTLKDIGFLNDHMLVMRALSENADATLVYNSKSIYRKWLNSEGHSEGAKHAHFRGILDTPLRYNAAVAMFMLPQINQRKVKVVWYFKAIFLLTAVAIKMIARRPSKTVFFDLFGYYIALTRIAVEKPR